VSQEKTEPATPKKLRDARKKGEVAYSKDFTQTVLVLSLFGYMLGNAEQIVNQLSSLILLPVQALPMEFNQAASFVLTELLHGIALALLPFLLIVLVLGIFSDALQVGLAFAFEALKPSGKKLNVIANAKNMVSAKNLVEFLKSTIKVLFLSALLYFVLRDALPTMLLLPHSGIDGVGHTVGRLLKIMMMNIAVAYAFIAFADLVWQRHKFRKDQMMTKHEVKQEYKQMEGNQELKHQRKHLHQEMLMDGAVEKTRKSSVLITNPTHLAAAIYYKSGETTLPIVLALGSGSLAERMRQAARQAQIPIVHDVPLARALMADAEIDHYIPAELIEPVAAVLRLVDPLQRDEEEE